MSTIELVDPELRDALALWPQQALTADSLTQRRTDLLKVIGAVPDPCRMGCRSADLPTYHTMAYFAELKNAPYKRWVELGEGTHFVMLEKNRIQFIHEVELFLEESPQALD